MAHWDDSGTAVGYEGKKGDKLIRKSLGIRKTKKKAKTKKRPAPMKLDTKLKGTECVIDEGYDLDRLYNIFNVTDEDDIEGILGGTIGEEN